MSYTVLNQTLQDFFTVCKTNFDALDTQINTDLSIALNAAIAELDGGATPDTDLAVLYSKLVTLDAQVTTLGTLYETDAELATKIQEIKDAYEAADTAFMQVVAGLATKTDLTTTMAAAKAEALAHTDSEVITTADAMTIIFLRGTAEEFPQSTSKTNLDVDVYLRGTVISLEYRAGGTTSETLVHGDPGVSYDINNRSNGSQVQFHGLPTSPFALQLYVTRNDGKVVTRTYNVQPVGFLDIGEYTDLDLDTARAIEGEPFEIPNPGRCSWTIGLDE